MKEFKTFIGIDISKKTFDVALLQNNNCTSQVHQCFEQSMKGYSSFIDWLKCYGILVDDTVLICMEHTGIYIHGLIEFLVHHKANIWVEMALRIKKTLGLQRGTNDKLASISIATYAYRYQEQARLWKPMNTSIEQLRHLIAQRDRIIISLKQLTVPLNELASCGDASNAKSLQKLQQKAINGLKSSLQNIEAAIDIHIQKEEEIHNAINKMSSVKGVGKQTAVSIYVYTQGFTAFENAKQLACYCGVVPFNKSSGTSVRFKPSVSPFANHKLKRLLHLCALAALQWDAEIKAYYSRKVAEGKNKMSVINAIRNKLVHRIFAVVRDDRMYVSNYQCAVNK